MKRKPFPDVMSTGDVRKHLRVSYQYIDQLVREGKLRCKLTAAGKIFLSSEVAEFMKERQQRAQFDPRIQLK